MPTPPPSPGVLDQVEHLAASPWAWCGLLIAGLFLLTTGEKLIRPGAMLASALIGAFVGSIIAPKFTAAPVAGMPVPFFGGVVGLILGVALGAAAYRAILVGTSGLLGALAATLIAATQCPDLPDPSASLPPAAQWAKAGLTTEPAATLRDSLAQAWDTVPVHDRATLAGAALVGLLAGTLAGGLMPRKSGAAITAALGAAFMLGSGVWLARRAGADPLGTTGPTGLLIAWGVLTIIGLGVQLRPRGGSRPAPTPAPTTQPSPA